MSVFAFIAADLVAIGLMVFALYFPRHRRRDLVVAFLSINVGVMGVTFAMSTAELSLGFGLGIFAVLSIIRLRSTEMDHAEIAYYFTAIALGLLGGFPSTSPNVSFTLMAVLLGVIAVGDSRALLSRARQQTMVLDRAVTDEAVARDLVGDILGARIDRVTLHKVDLVSETTLCDVRFTLPTTGGTPGRNVDSFTGRPVRLRPARGLDAHHGSGRPMTDWIDAVHLLPALTLDEVNERAELQTRIDRKYVVQPAVWGTVLASLGDEPGVLEIGRATQLPVLLDVLRHI